METTHPQPGVAQATPEARIAAIMAREEAPSEPQDEEVRPAQSAPQADETAEETDGQDAEGETPEDQLESGAEAPPEVETFEIVHDGQSVKLTREQMIENARKGFDYTRKTQQVAEKARVVTETLEMLKEVEMVQPMLAQDRAEVAALEAQLQRYQNVDWVKLATDDPLEYPKHRAQYDVLVNAYQNKRGEFDRKDYAVRQQVWSIRQKQLQEEEARLPELIPEWKDEAKQRSGREELTKYLIAQGADPNMIGLKTQDALSVSIAWKAMQFDKLSKGKAEKVGQLRKLPPVTVPGAGQNPSAAKADKDKELRQRLRKSGNAEDAMAVILNRIR